MIGIGPLKEPINSYHYTRYLIPSSLKRLKTLNSEAEHGEDYDYERVIENMNSNPGVPLKFLDDHSDTSIYSNPNMNVAYFLQNAEYEDEEARVAILKIDSQMTLILQVS